jgi:hypothetical protein
MRSLDKYEQMESTESICALLKATEEITSRHTDLHYLSRTKLESVYYNTDFECYHLHPELVTFTQPEMVTTDINPHTFKFYACPQCKSHLDQKRLPPLSLAKGIDFGLSSRLQMPKLSVPERMLIARYRMFTSIVKLVGSGAGKHCFKGHIVNFAHNAPEAFLSATATMPDVEGVSRLLTVAFLDINGRTDETRMVLMEHENFRVRPAVVYQWLKLLKEVHPMYADITIDESSTMTESLNSFSASLLDNALDLNSESANRMECIVTSDTANIRSNPAEPDATTSSDPPLLSEVLVTSRTGTNLRLDSGTSLYSNDANRLLAVVNAIAPPIQSNRTSSVPVNEFTDNDQLLYGSFPHVFPFGSGLPTRGSLTTRHTRHLLMQFQGQFSEPVSILFISLYIAFSFPSF